MKSQTEKPIEGTASGRSANRIYTTAAVGFCAGLLSLTGCAWMPFVGGGDESPEQQETQTHQTTVGSDEESKSSDMDESTSGEKQADAEQADDTPSGETDDTKQAKKSAEEETTDQTSDSDGDEKTADKKEPRAPVTTGRPVEEKEADVIPGEKTIIDWQSLPE